MANWVLDPDRNGERFWKPGRVSEQSPCCNVDRARRNRTVDCQQDDEEQPESAHAKSSAESGKAPHVGRSQTPQSQISPRYLRRGTFPASMGDPKTLRQPGC